MKNRLVSVFKIIFASLLLCVLITSCVKEDDDFSEVIKIALRDVGNKLLLENNDSTSLILPIKKINHSKYELTFNSDLSLEPNNIVSITKNSFEKAMLPSNFRIEVIQCADKEVAYSCEVNKIDDLSILPCAGRLLPKKCYAIYVKFLDRNEQFSGREIFFYLYVIFISFLLIFYFVKKRQAHFNEQENNNYSLGLFKFYPEQNKLVKSAEEINLSKKECELLEIFVANPNKVIKRDELTKKVWEDHGVIVGRSLDTYISKLRKKLQDDESIKLTNIHGVGYKLEIQTSI